MAVFNDSEFGSVTIRRSKLSRQVKLSVAPNGTLRISMPMYAPIFLAKRLVNSSRKEIRTLLDQQPQGHDVTTDGQIGKSHHLTIVKGQAFSVQLSDRQIIVTTPDQYDLTKSHNQSVIREAVAKALRREAKSYLPQRLKYLAEQHGFYYKKVRFSHASTRWGSCSTNGTISLNIALMKLPFELIDYVLLHELCHTVHMNHSQNFWRLMEQSDPLYRAHKKQLSTHTPSI